MGSRAQGARGLPGVLGPSALVQGAGGFWMMAGCCCCTLLCSDHVSEAAVFGISPAANCPSR